MPRRWILVTRTVLAITAATHAAFAQDAADIAVRRELIQRAQQESTAGHHREALDDAERAERISPSTSLRAVIAHEEQLLGMYAEALGNAEQCRREAVADERLANRELILHSCEAIITDVHPRIAHLTVHVEPAPDGLHVRVAGHELRTALLGVPYVVTPGAVLVEAEAPGHDSVRRTVTLTVGQSGDVTLALATSTPTSTTVPTVPSTAPSAAPMATGSSAAPGHRGEFVAVHRGGVPGGAIVLGVLGVVAIGGAFFAGAQADGLYNRAEQNGSMPSDDNLTRRDNANAAGVWRWGEVGGFIGGGVLLVTGVLIGVLGRDRLEAHVTASVEPTPGGAVLTIGGRL